MRKPIVSIRCVGVPLVMSLVMALVIALVASLVALPPASAVAAGNDSTPWYLPVRPPRCTSKQMIAGTVQGCLVTGRDAADESGWPNPPFPSDPATGSDVAILPSPGWRWGGYGYNGSPALAEWESLMVANSSPIGPLRTGALRSMPEALPLFEGFLRDIIAGGYRVGAADTYSFRCTSGTNMSCAGLSEKSLSNHSWGLAMDMNAGANPQMTYSGVGGATACATPIITDIPKWVVDTAQKWGLYWGGYGWNSGCTSPEEIKDAASRDTHHFEFRGSTTQARAIAAENLGSMCIDVANDAGALTPRCLLAGEIPGAGWRVVIDTKAPTGSTAALVNITMTGAHAPGFVTAEPCTAITGARTSSNGNAVPNQTVANLAVVPLDASGRFCLYRSQPMQTIVDVQGFFATAKVAGDRGTLFTAVSPERVIDTRTTSLCQPDGQCASIGPVTAGLETEVNTPMVPEGAVAVLANLTVTDPVVAGYLTADSCSALIPGPQSHSNANFGAGDTIANLAVVPSSAARTLATGQRFCTYATDQTQQIVDIQGYFGPPSLSVDAAGWGFTSLPSQRVIDTRGCWTDPSNGTQRCAMLNEPGAIIRLNAPPGAAAVLINLTLTEATSNGFARAAPCSQMQGVAQQSNGNVATGAIAANLAVVSVDVDGTFCVSVSSPMHVVVDVQGTFAPKGLLRFMPTSPERCSDTRLTLG